MTPNAAVYYLTKQSAIERLGAQARGRIAWYLSLVRSEYARFDQNGWPVPMSNVHRRAPRRERA